MSCLRTRQMLDGWLDGELDQGTSSTLAQHMAGCPDCNSARVERERLRAVLRATPRHPAPAGFRRGMVARLRAEGALRNPDAHDVESAATPSATPPHAMAPHAAAQRRLPWWQALVLAAASSAMAVLVTVLVLRPPAGESAPPLREQLVARHVASLASRHLIDVASSDRHTIKPWLLGKVDFAPQVRDMSAQGFTLEGARLDQVGDHPAVAVVYKLRAHPVNLFVWRQVAPSSETGGAGAGVDAVAAVDAVVTERGFSVAQWSDGGLHYAAVSDADAGEIARFVREQTALR